MAADFLEASARFQRISKIYNTTIFTRVPLRTRIVVLTTAPVAEAVSELAAKSVSSGSFASAQSRRTKVAEFLVISNELAKSAAPSSYQHARQ